MKAMEKNIPDFLRDILEHKKLDIARDKETLSLDGLRDELNDLPDTLNFTNELRQNISQKRNAIIGEAKKASPLKGILREEFNVPEIAKGFQENGACCLSILTDEMFFNGHVRYIRDARKVSTLPILRKDFIIDPYQIYRSRWMGADCILLIAMILSDEQMASYKELSERLQMDVMIEVHNLEELKRALKIKPDMIGINNRNLHSFDVDLNTTIDLLPHIPDNVLVITESGITTKEDIKLMNDHGVYGFLIGAALMIAPDPGKALKELL